MEREGRRVLELIYDTHQGPFCGCPGDADVYARDLHEEVDAIALGGMRPELYYWRKSYDPGAGGAAVGDQFRIARTSSPTIGPVFILFAQSVGTPVRPPPEGWREMRTWLDGNGWSFVALLGEVDFDDSTRVPAGKIPLTGTMYELFDAMRNGYQKQLEIFDLSAFTAPPAGLTVSEREEQARWRSQLLTELRKSHRVRAPKTRLAFIDEAKLALRATFGAAPLDPRTDALPGLEPIKEVGSLFARQTETQALTARVFEDNAAMTILLGTSGVGKSSLLRAGLMGTWFRASPMGMGLWHRATAILVRPEHLLVALGPSAEVGDAARADPLESLGLLLCGSITADGAGVIGPTPAPLEGYGGRLPPLTNSFEGDLAGALTWWEAIVAPVGGPVVVILDQAEQIDAYAHQAARDAADTNGEAPPASVLSPEWARFTGLLGLLTERLEPALLPAHLVERVRHLTSRCPLRLIVSVDRREALDLWSLKSTPTDTLVLEPISGAGNFNDIITQTLARYGLTLDRSLVAAMAEEAALLADSDIAVRAVAGADSRTVVGRASVLPQVLVAIQGIIERWRELDSSQMELSTDSYADRASIAGAIAAVGEAAFIAWLTEEYSRGPSILAGFYHRHQFDDEKERQFDDLLGCLVDARSSDRSELTYLSRSADKHRKHARLIAILQQHRLLVRTDALHIRLAHRAVLDHWPRAREWMLRAETKLLRKGYLAEYYRKDKNRSERTADGGWSRWEPDELEGFVDLAFDWVGGGEGEDANIQRYLAEGLVGRMDFAAVAANSPRPIDRLPFRAMFANHEPLLAILGQRFKAADLTADQKTELLIGAAEAGRSDMATILLELGADPEGAHSTGAFPLLSASQGGSLEIVERLLAAGASPQRSQPSTGHFPLLLAADHGHSRVVSALLAAGAAPDQAQDSVDTTPLALALQNGDATTAAILLAGGASPTRVDHMGHFPLVIAAHQGSAPNVEILLKAGALPDQTDSDTGVFPLAIASQFGRYEAVKVLLAHGASPSMRHMRTGAVPLALAAQNGHAEIVDALIAAGALLDDATRALCPRMLNVAAGFGHAAVVSSLVKAGISADDESFPLLLACQNGHHDVADVLLTAGAKPDRVDEKTGYFPLLMAAQNGHVLVVAALLRAGARADQLHASGMSPLFMASQNGHTATVAALLSSGVDPDEVDPRDGAFPLFQATLSGHSDVVRALLNAGAQPDRQTANGEFALLLAAGSGHAETTAVLLNAGASLQLIQASTGHFPLLLAVGRGHAGCVAALMDAGVSVSQRHRASGLNGYSVAVGRGDSQIVSIIRERAKWDVVLPKELRDTAMQLLSRDQPLTMKVPSKSLEGGRRPFPLPGPWGAIEVTEATSARVLEGVAQMQVSTRSRASITEIFSIDDFGGTETALLFATMSVDLGYGRRVAVDAMWWDLKRPFSGYPTYFALFPGANFAAVLQDLAALGTRGPKWGTDEARCALACLALLCSEGGYPVRGRGTLPLEPDAPLLTGGHPELEWSSWAVGSSPAGRIVTLSWVSGSELVRGSVTVPYDGVGTRVLPNRTVIATGLRSTLPPYLVDQDGRPTPLRLREGNYA